MFILDPTDDRNNAPYPPMGGAAPYPPMGAAPYPPAGPGYGAPGYQGQGGFPPTVGFANPSYPTQPGRYSIEI